MSATNGGLYLVWDWNGTLFDDRSLLFQSIAATLQQWGYGEPSSAEIVAKFTRPLRALFERLIGGKLSSQDWGRLERDFHNIYQGELSRGALVPDVHQALVRGRAQAQGQALLSQWPHGDLLEIIRRHRLTGFFDEVWGRSEDCQNKEDRIGDLLHRNRLSPDRVVLIGDTQDDIAAATAAGIGSVLVVGASLARLDPSDVAAMAVPVAHSPAEAVELALHLAGRRGRVPTAGTDETRS
ncbi:phosphoglycolate phosphatase [Mycobacterium basiliense]|uniref:Phosphoglycolate phosphatase n=1 Tax=Mycobacterium basiliense TaxID=2094119 RepID=A0A3S4FMK0_9MYCO|nr:HAD hydrolase-like protein [Mycobacterium basiliense]VDM86568.1 phosphoglycolate phosphatase [Mycobacterium basiliense]